MDDDDLRALQAMIAARPTGGSTMVGTGGLRKIRFAPEGRGKSGAFRICYVHVPERSEVALLIVFGKGDKANFDAAEKKVARELVRRVKGGAVW